MAVLLEVTDLVKDYGSFRAVDHVSFTLSEGEVLGFLGPNGAGKTTTIQMLLGLTTPTSGTIRYFGKDFNAHRSDILERINFVSAYSQMQTRVTVRQDLHVFAKLYAVSHWEEEMTKLAELLGVTRLLDTIYWNLSSGEKARVNLVKALLNRPKLILMDEPTASLDPEIVNVVLSLIADIQKREKVAILYTSHNMVEVARVCDRVAFLDHGKIIVVDTPLGLTKRVGKATLQVTFDGDAKPVTTYLQEKKHTYSLLRAHVVAIQLEETAIPKVLFGLGERKVWITDIEINKPDLEDVFLAIAKGGAHAVA